MRLSAIALATLSAALAVVAAADEGPRNIRVCVQFIEVPHPVLTELMANPESAGAALHDKVLALVNGGTVKLLESCVVTGKHAQRMTIESIREMIYPIEYEPAGGMWPLGAAPVPGQAPLPQPPRKATVRPDLCTACNAWETRNVGTTLEIEPNISDNGRMIDLRLVPEIVQLARLDTITEYVDRWGDGSIRMPVFQAWRTNTSMTLLGGQFAMVGVITPKSNTPGPAVTRKILMFVRADILPVRTQP